MTIIDKFYFCGMCNLAIITGGKIINRRIGSHCWISHFEWLGRVHRDFLGWRGSS